MPNISVLKQVFHELTSRKDSFRIPEPDLVMDDSAQVAAFHEAGREDGIMAPAYLFHTAQVSAVIRPGETVLDLGCGPANQLGQIARLNPDVRFVGMDLSEEMLAMAKQNLTAKGVRNVELILGDITDLKRFGEASMDAIISTATLHHLPNEAALYHCFAEIRRILKPAGGLYLVDLGHLKTETAIHYFAHQYADREPPLFVQDYYHSLRAAFELDTWKTGWKEYLFDLGKVYSTFAIPYMIAVKSPIRRNLPEAVRHALRQLLDNLPAWHQRDFSDLSVFFKLGGLRTPTF